MAAAVCVGGGCGSDATRLRAVVVGTSSTPFANGRFRLSVVIPERYPYEPPKVRFVTPIYHPNVDRAGRICLSTLQMPPGLTIVCNESEA